MLYHRYQSTGMNTRISQSAVYTTTGSTTILETATSTTPRWIELPEYLGNAIVNGLESGIYRAIATDARVSTCDGNEFITRNIIISENTLICYKL